MNKHLMSVVISFSELAWIFLLVGGLLYARDPDEPIPAPDPSQTETAKLQAELQKKNTELDNARKKNEDLQKQLAQRPKRDELDKALDENENLKEQLAQLARRPKQDDLEKALKDCEKLQKQVALGHSNQAVVNRDLIGLKGNMQRVVFVVDRSASMNSESRWAAAREIIKAWIKHLDVKQAAIVVFNRDVGTYPLPTADSAWGYLDIEHAGTAGMVQYLSGLRPEGGKNLAKALGAAFRFADPDAIILFTDGDVTRIQDFSDVFQGNIKRQVQEVYQKHPGVPINVIGLCNYMSRNAGEFLRDLAKETGGAFIGR